MQGQAIYDEAVQEIKDLEEQIRDTYEEPPQFLVG
jgi:CHASE3 domain sensor protein